MKISDIEYDIMKYELFHTNILDSSKFKKLIESNIGIYKSIYLHAMDCMLMQNNINVIITYIESNVHNQFEILIHMCAISIILINHSLIYPYEKNLTISLLTQINNYINNDSFMNKLKANKEYAKFITNRNILQHALLQWNKYVIIKIGLCCVITSCIVLKYINIF